MLIIMMNTRSEATMTCGVYGCRCKWCTYICASRAHEITPPLSMRQARCRKHFPAEDVHEYPTLAQIRAVRNRDWQLQGLLICRTTRPHAWLGKAVLSPRIFVSASVWNGGIATSSRSMPSSADDGATGGSANNVHSLRRATFVSEAASPSFSCLVWSSNEKASQ